MRRRNENIFETNDQLVDYLRDRGALESDRVELAFRSVDRALFLPKDMITNVYIDRPLGKTIGGGAKIHHSAPHMYASCLEQLDVQPGQSVLNLGSGTGYLSTLLAFLVGPEGAVQGVEVFPELVQHAQRCLNEFNSTPLQEEAAAGAAAAEAQVEEGQPPQQNEPDEDVAQDQDQDQAAHTVHQAISRLACSVETVPRPTSSGTTAGIQLYSVISADAQLLLGLLQDEGAARQVSQLWPNSIVQPMKVGTFLRPPSYLDMVGADPSPDVSAFAVQGWAICQYLGFTPPTSLQMAQRCLAFAVSQLCDHRMPSTTTARVEASLPIDIIGSIGQEIRTMKFPRVSAEVTFTAGNALSLCRRKRPASRYDRIYVAAQAERTELERLRELLRPGGILIGPFENVLVKVSRGLGAHSQWSRL